jgi:mRNA-degrading endonuclease RelE of RelBE toxin-antitoxin system
LNARVIWEQDALEALVRIARSDQVQAIRIMRAVYAWAATGQGDVRKLQGAEEEWRLRSGDWRVIFARDGRDVHVLRVLNRRDAYR